MSVAQRWSSLGGEVEQADEVVDDAVEAARRRSAPREPRADRAGRRPRRACLSVASAIAVSHSFDHGSGDAAKKARASLPKILSPIGLSSRLPVRQARRPPVSLVEDALGLQQQRLAESLGGDDDELVVAIRGQEAVDLGRPVQERTRRSPRRPGCRRRRPSRLALARPRSELARMIRPNRPPVNGRRSPGHPSGWR